MITAFLDTNIVIDFYQKREPFFTHASAIFTLAKNQNIVVAVSAITIVNCFYLLKKYYDRSMLYEKMSALCQLACVTEINDSSVQEALKQEWPDFEDCVQYISASNNGYDYIVTRNVSDYIHSSIPVLMPEDFLNTITE